MTLLDKQLTDAAAIDSTASLCSTATSAFVEWARRIGSSFSA
jgi:hypothetical protein